MGEFQLGSTTLKLKKYIESMVFLSEAKQDFCNPY